MISYKVFINSTTIYAIEIVRIDDLTSISRLNNYEYRVYNEAGLKSNPVTEKDRYLCGTIKHRYKDSVFVLMNKVNKLIIKKEKSDLEHQKKMVNTFNLIKGNRDPIDRLIFESILIHQFNKTKILKGNENEIQKEISGN